MSSSWKLLHAGNFNFFPFAGLALDVTTPLKPTLARRQDFDNFFVRLK